MVSLCKPVVHKLNIFGGGNLIEYYKSMGGPRKGGGTKSWNFSGGAKGWDTIFDSNLVGGGGNFGENYEKTLQMFLNRKKETEIL